LSQSRSLRLRERLDLKTTRGILESVPPSLRVPLAPHVCDSCRYANLKRRVLHQLLRTATPAFRLPIRLLLRQEEAIYKPILRGWRHYSHSGVSARIKSLYTPCCQCVQAAVVERRLFSVRLLPHRRWLRAFLRTYDPGSG
jgi:hypothetical protein